MNNLKKYGKLILSKIPIFIFCVVFIKGFAMIFDDDNTVIGVSLLTALFFALKSNFGYKTWQGALSIPIITILMVVAPKTAELNPYLGIPINLISIFLILVLTSHDTENDNHVPYLMGYVFAIGYDVSNQVFVNRILGAAIVGFIIGILYYVIHRKKECTVGILDIFKDLNFKNLHTKWYITLTVTMTITIFFGSLFGYPRVMWIVFAVLSLIRPTMEESIQRTKHRIPATILGSLLFFVVFEFIVPEQYQVIVSFATGFIMMFITSYFKKTIANSFNALITAMLLFSSTSAVIIRMFSNIIGVVVVIVSQLVFAQIFKDNNKTAA